jgi:hypothetical protein
MSFQIKDFQKISKVYEKWGFSRSYSITIRTAIESLNLKM